MIRCYVTDRRHGDLLSHVNAAIHDGVTIIQVREKDLAARELYELSRAERARVVEDVSWMARALAQVYQPVKMNYELLGNQVAHIHWHLVPRLAGDPEPQWPVWRVQHEPSTLPADEVAARIEAIRRALGAPR